MFESLTPAPPDAIFGLLEAFGRDTRPGKINLSAGVYSTEDGTTPILDVVKEAQRRLLEAETTKSYLPIAGLEAFRRRVPRLVLGSDHPALGESRLTALQAPGGTGALRVFAELLRNLRPDSRIWMSRPTWSNHPQVFRATGVAVADYPYYDPATRGLAFEDLMAALEGVEAGDVVLLHGACHNPTGVDPTADQWREIGRVLERRGALPLVDFAYHGFGRGLDEDAAAVRHLTARLPEAAVAVSYSKTLGLYRERTGALILTAPSRDSAGAVHTHAQQVVRTLYSNPPAHGAQVVATVLADEALTRSWHAELGTMRERLTAMRRRLVAGLDERGVRLGPQGNGFLLEQQGMFSYTDLPADAVRRLRDDHAVYLVDSGRINVAGLNRGNVDRLCDAVAAVV